MLTHHNVLSNIDSANALFRLGDDDIVMGVLPFFHSFGYTVTLWLPLVVGFGAAYHPNPTDAKTIGEMAAKYGATLLVSTPTFCAAYVRKCQPEQFSGFAWRSSELNVCASRSRRRSSRNSASI